MFEQDIFSFPRTFDYQEGLWEKSQEGLTTSQISFEEPNISIEALYQSSSVIGLDIPTVNGKCDFGCLGTNGSLEVLEEIDVFRFPIHLEANRSMLDHPKWWQKSRAKYAIEGCLPDILSLDRAHLFPSGSQRNVRQDIKVFPPSQSLLRDVLAKHWNDLIESSSSAFVVTGCPIHEGGGGPVMQMAFVLAQAHFVLKSLEEKGADVVQGFNLLRPEVSTSSHIFMSLCMLRALRFLWAGVGRKIGLSPHQIKHDTTAVTSSRMLTKKTPWNNLTRCTYAMIGAFFGGASEVFLTPFVAPLGTPSHSGMRLMRNLHALTHHETYLESVNDPGKGSFFVETLTKQLVSKSWSLFQRIQKHGGFSSGLSFIQDYVEKEKAKRRKIFFSQKSHVVGVSLFPGEKKDEGDIKKYFSSLPYPETLGLSHLPWEGCHDDELSNNDQNINEKR